MRSWDVDLTRFDASQRIQGAIERVDAGQHRGFLVILRLQASLIEPQQKTRGLLWRELCSMTPVVSDLVSSAVDLWILTFLKLCHYWSSLSSLMRRTVHTAFNA